MTAYGIKLVWAGWNDDDVIGFSDQGYKRWKDTITPGTRMLVYETTGQRPGHKHKGTKSIVGEVEVTGTFDDGERMKSPTEAHARVVPVKVLRTRQQSTPIPLTKIRELLGDEDYPRMGETWKPLTEEQYKLFLHELD